MRIKTHDDVEAELPEAWALDANGHPLRWFDPDRMGNISSGFHLGARLPPIRILAFPHRATPNYAFEPRQAAVPRSALGFLAARLNTGVRLHG
jgi:hypothetical protein